MQKSAERLNDSSSLLIELTKTISSDDPRVSSFHIYLNSGSPSYMFKHGDANQAEHPLSRTDANSGGGHCVRRSHSK